MSFLNSVRILNDMYALLHKPQRVSLILVYFHALKLSLDLST